MTDRNKKINEALTKIEELISRQVNISKEIYKLKEDLLQLKGEELQAEIKETIIQSMPDVERETIEPLPVTVPAGKETIQVAAPIRANIEKFIGENLINKVGIGITIIGVAIGARYSIEHDLISPVTRIIIGYLAGLALFVTGLKLKKNYSAFSAVLVSGAMTILYFITFAAYHYYGLLSQLFAFIIMVIITLITVISAIKFNRQVIAHIGLVGAYAVPFLLSDGSGRMIVLFTYMSIINIGIIALAIKKYWKTLYYSSFIVTWLIYFSWFAFKRIDVHEQTAWIFLSIFFGIFYCMFLAYKLIHKEKFALPEIMLIISNAFLFYGFGYGLLESGIDSNALGLFTFCNAILHALVSLLIYRQRLTDMSLFYLIAGLGVVFITLTIPVQLDGNWVTLLWAMEATLLFAIGRLRNDPIYEKLSYPLMLLAFISILHDWFSGFMSYYDYIPRFAPFLNINFISSLFFSGCFIIINYLYFNKRYAQISTGPIVYRRLLNYVLPSILILVLYVTFSNEISICFDKYINPDLPQLDTGWKGRYTDIVNFKSITLINYSLLFLVMMSFLNLAKIKSNSLGRVNIFLMTIALFVFLSHGLYVVSELRDSYLLAEQSKGAIYILIRYLSLPFLILALLSIYRYIKADFMRSYSTASRIMFDLLLYTTIVWVTSSELINWMNILRFSQSYKLGLSILWGLTALTMISLGIWKNKKHLRIFAIILFGITLIKLFFYDIAHLNTIAKTIVFVSLGILLLIISFLYNKYRHIISGEEEKQ